MATRASRSQTARDLASIPTVEPTYVELLQQIQTLQQRLDDREQADQQRPEQADMRTILTEIIQQMRSNPKDIDTPKPKILIGMTFKEYEDWIFIIDSNINMKQSQYNTESQKVNLAVAWLGRVHRAQWDLHEQHLAEQITYEKFKEWLRDRIENPIHRGFSAAIHLNQLEQQPNQNPDSFYYEYNKHYEAHRQDATGEALTDDIAKGRLFVAKLLPWLREAVLATKDVGTTMPDILATVRLNYDIHKGKHITTSKSNTESKNQRSTPNPNSSFNKNDKKPKRRQNDSESNSTRSQNEGGKQSSKKQKTVNSKAHITCHKCGKKGHYANECRSNSKPGKNDKNPTLGALSEEKEPEPQIR